MPTVADEVSVFESSSADDLSPVTPPRMAAQAKTATTSNFMSADVLTSRTSCSLSESFGWVKFYLHAAYVVRQGTDVIIFKIFSPKKLRKNWRFWLITKLNYAKILIITLVFEKTPIISPNIGKNRRKL
jgi:hypothetical protein